MQNRKRAKITKEEETKTMVQQYLNLGIPVDACAKANGGWVAGVYFL